MTPGKVTIATPSAAWESVEKVRRIHRWLMKVSSQCRETTEIELPREVGERTVPGIGVDPWAVRAKKAVLTPDFPMAIWSFIGRVLGEDYRLDLEGDEDLVKLYEDVDKRGNDLQVFLQRAFKDLWLQASPFVLVDDAPGGGRPFWVLFRANQVKLSEWGEDANGVLVPKRLHLWNPKKGKLTRPKRNRIRVLLGDGEPSYNPETRAAGPGAALGTVGARWEWWEEDEKENWRPSTAEDEKPGRFTEDEIPGVLFMCGREDDEDPEIVYPPAEWLGEACLAKFRERSDHKGFVRMLRTIILFWQGLGVKDFIEANDGSVITFSHITNLFGGSNASVDLKAIETTGAAAALSFKDMEDVEALVKMARLMPIDPQKVQTLGEAQLDEHQAMTPLSVAATHFRDGTEQLMKITAARLGKEKPGTLHIPTLFTLSDAEEKDLAMIRELQKEGSISWLTAMEKLKLGNRKLEDVDLKQEATRLAEEQREKDAASARRVRAMSGGDPIGEDE